MVVVLVLLIVVVFATAGLLVGFHIASAHTREALKLARYLDAIALVDDLVKTPDALDLRTRAQKILAAHHASFHSKES